MKLCQTVTIINRKGLHARASAKFAALAEQYEASITVSRDNLTVSAGSVMGLLLLAAAQGTEIILTAEGPQQKAAMEALCALVARRFDETQ